MPSSSLAPSSSVVPSSSSSVAPSSVSSSHPQPSEEPIGVNLLGTDANLVKNTAGHWIFESNYPQYISTHTCGGGTPVDGCVVFETDYTAQPSIFTASFAYTATTVPGNSYKFSFGAYSLAGTDYPVGNIYCTASNAASPQTAQLTIDVNSLRHDFHPESLSWKATTTSSVIKCQYAFAVPYLTLGFTSFEFVRTA